MAKKVVGVIGGRSCTREVEKLAIDLGQALAGVFEVLVCGGMHGVMQAVCQGFKSAGGFITVGIIPGYDKNDANKHVDIVIPTGLGVARNVMVVKTSDVIIALPGGPGTLSEIAYGLQFRIPVISLKSWNIPGVIKVDTVKDAISKLQ